MKYILYSLWQRHHEKTLVLADQAVVSGSNFAIGILISKAFGLRELGTYAFAWMLLMMCSSLQQSYMNMPMVNDYAAKTTSAREQHIQQLFSMQLVLAMGMTVVCFIGITFMPYFSFFKTLQELELALPVLVFFYSMYDFIRRVYSLKNSLLKMLFIDTLINWLQVGFLVYNVFQHTFSLTDMLWFFAFTYLFGFLIGLIEFFRLRSLNRKVFKMYVHHWNITSWLLAAAVLQWFAGNFFILSAGSLLGAEAAGVVRIAQSITGVLNVFFIALELYVPLRAAQILLAGGRQKLRRYMQKITIAGLIVCGLFALIVWEFSEPLLKLLYGVSYMGFAGIVTLFAFLYLLIFLGYPLRFALRALQNTKATFIAYVLAAAFSLVFSDLMVQAWGIMGVLAGLAITQLIMQGWYVKELVRHYKLNL